MKVDRIENIYIRLLEGPETLVSVTAVHQGNSVFKILTNPYLDLEEDISSIWEFFPGDTVKCVKRNENLLASELISSEFPNRRMHQLIFLIVKNLGEVTLGQLEEFENEVKLLCSDRHIVQKQHPVVKKWLTNNCSLFSK